MKKMLLSSKGLLSMLIASSLLFSRCQKEETVSPLSVKDDLEMTTWSSTSGVKNIDLSKVNYNSGYAYMVTDWFGVGGDNLWSTSSTLKVYENGVALGPAHSSHQDVRTIGKGKFSHWGNDLYFTASDNSDPRYNGRKYTYTITDVASTTTTSSTTTSSTAKTINLSNVTLNSGNAFLITEWFGVGGDTKWTTTSTLKVFENDRELGPAHSAHHDVASYGKGRFSHFGNNLYFSASDNTDPRYNGRKYSYTTDGSSPASTTSTTTTWTAPSTTPTQTISSPTGIQENVIFDTDPGGDVDDAGALAVLHALADRGEIKILAMGVSIGHENAVPFVDAVNTWYGRPDLPIGAIKSGASYSADYYMKNITDRYPSNATQYNAPEVVDLYRKVLAAQPDKSVTLIAVGPSTNISKLLSSGPDHHSSLNGVELVRKKVKFYAAGGNGNGGLPYGQAGFNYYMDLNSASNELNLLPSDFPTVFAGGSGSKLEMGSGLNNTRWDHIIRKSYESYFYGTAKDRATWDQLRVLYACRPASRAYFNTSARGKIQVNSSRIISYTSSWEKNHAYAYVNNFTQIRDELAKLMQYDPRD
ncbi:MAG: nucleoside hydrolase [Daejeonella sp.]|uniref:nucleoside hydrolase n=1 Tax=Daejeonella sp. TaxID=2805397 RepID=UPI003C78B13A